MPVALREKPPIFIHTPKQDGTPRAVMEDGVRLWFERYKPRDGIVCVVSNCPYIEYQRRITRVILTSQQALGMRVIAMGLAARNSADMEPCLRIGLLLDTLASTLYRARQEQALGLFENRPKPS